MKSVKAYQELKDKRDVIFNEKLELHDKIFEMRKQRKLDIDKFYVEKDKHIEEISQFKRHIFTLNSRLNIAKINELKLTS